jgi:hypothetical protein
MSNLGVNFEDLRKAVDWSISQLEEPRKNRITAIEQFVGSHYSDKGAEKRVPINFLELAVTIYIRQLAARAPRAMVSTSNPRLRPFAKNTEIAMNQVPDEIGLGATIRRAVLEALFSIGIVKVGLCSSGISVLGHDYGEPFVDIVSIDDYFCDMSAKTRNSMQFEGNDYWIPVDAARAMYNKGEDLKPDDHTVIGERGEERAEGISVDEGATLYKDKVWLRDVWLVQENKLVTYGVKSLKLLNVVDWDGPEHGPYHVLGFSEVPGNLLPLPPVALWYDLHDLGNRLFRKLARQADTKKTVAAFAGGNDKDVERLKAASDGEGIQYSGQKPEVITVGGIDSSLLALTLQVRDLFSYFAGNLDSAGGLAVASETVGQEKLISEAASTRLNDMRDETISFARNIFKSLFWYEWTDPVRERVIEKPVKGVDISTKSIWSEATREGDFLDYNFNIDVYSMQGNTPSEKLQKIGLVLERFVFPALPMFEQQGGQLDLKELISLLSELGNIPELNDVVKFKSMDPEERPIQAQGAATPTRMPATTTRRYERISRPGATRQGKDDVMTRALMGIGVQGSEMATLGRPV